VLVVQQEIRLVEQAGHTERQNLVAHTPIEDGQPFGDRAVGHRDRRPADRVVHHFVPYHHAKRVRAGLTGEVQADNLVVAHQKRADDVAGTDDGGVIESRHAVPEQSARDDLVDGYEARGEIEAVGRCRSAVATADLARSRHQGPQVPSDAGDGEEYAGQQDPPAASQGEESASGRAHPHQATRNTRLDVRRRPPHKLAATV